jgi:hypothetical protein
MVRSLVVASVLLGGGGAMVACVSAPTLTTLEEGNEGGLDEAGNPLVDAGGSGEAASPADDASMPTMPDPFAGVAACAAACPAAGGMCSGAMCVIACPGAPGCGGTIKCPPGVACNVTCSGAQSCAGIDCGTASSCGVTCNGNQSCGSIQGTAGQTTVNCTGKDACKDVGCGGATCAVTCADSACKPPDVKCCATKCTVNGMPGKCG